MMSENGIGASTLRKEDARFLTGKGRYTDDINRPRQLYAYIVRSPEAHASIDSIDSSAAEAAPGVVGVFTGQQMSDDGVGSLPCGWLIHNKDGSPMVEPPHIPLAVDRVRHVGDQVAVVVAESKSQAKEAAELLAIEYGPLPALASLAAAREPGAPLVWDDAAGNLCYDWEVGDKAAADAAFEAADHVVSLDLVTTVSSPTPSSPAARSANTNRRPVKRRSTRRARTRI